jgi:hypothetical protein
MDQLTPSRHLLQRLQRLRADSQDESIRKQQDDALWQRRCIERLPQQDLLTACLEAAMQPFPMPSAAAIHQRWRTLHPDITAPVAWGEMDLERLLRPEWHQFAAGAVCVEVLMAHTLPFFAQPAAVDFQLLREPRILHLCPAADDPYGTDPMHPPPVLVAFVRGWLEGLRRTDPGFSQRADGVIVRRALIMGVQTIFKSAKDLEEAAEVEEVVGGKRKQQQHQPVAPELLLWNNALGHQLLLLCELPPSSSTPDAAAAADMPTERPFTRIKLTIVDNMHSHEYLWPVHMWIAHAFARAQLDVWPDETEAAHACQCEFVCNALYTDEALSTTCMATSLRAVLIASLLRDPTAKLRQPESQAEGRRFATLIALHLCRMRRFLLTDERLWSATQPHAVFADGSSNGRINAANFKQDEAIGRPLVSPCMMWAVPLRHVPEGMAAADIARWVFERSMLRAHPIYFEPALSRPLGLTYRPPVREGTPTCITSLRLNTCGEERSRE